MKKKFFLIALALIFVSCSKKSGFIPVDNSDPLSLQFGVEWVLITSPYVSCHAEPDYNSSVEEHLRRGEIRVLDGEQTVKTDGVFEKWYFIEEGWVSENFVRIYSNKLKAESARKKLQ